MKLSRFAAWMPGAGAGASILADLPDSGTLLQGRTYSSNVLANVILPSGGIATVTAFTVTGSNQKLTPGSGPVTLRDPTTGVIVGTISLQSSGKYSFTSAPSYAGPVPALNLYVSDASGQVTTSTLTLDVLPSEYLANLSVGLDSSSAAHVRTCSAAQSFFSLTYSACSGQVCSG